MLFSTPSQFVVLVLLLVVGWFFGLASHPGGKKWKQAYKDESVGRAQDRDELDAQLRQSDSRIAELEKQNADLTAELDARRAELERARTAAPVAAVAASGAAVAASEARPATAAEPALTVAPPKKRGWFDWSRGDDLTRLRGVDGELARKLKAEQVETFAEVANLSDQDEIALERRIDLPAGYIQREQLREQARLLADGKDAEHADHFGGDAPVRPLPLN